MPLEVETSGLSARPFRVGEWLVEPSLNRLSRGDTTIQLELKVMDVLVCLAERAGEVLTRQEIVDQVWATEFISDNTLTHAITEIRNALGDHARNPSFIETIHRRGYRLIAPVEPVLSDEAVFSRVARFPVPESRAISDEDHSPYPGLAAFTEADAEFFFGREAEVAQMWRKLTSRRLLAVIGPSGVGKSSFIHAGVIPARPEGWGVVDCQPGEAPFPALARALVPEFAGDIEATTQLVDIRDGDRAIAMVSRWRDRCGQALLVVDQFEELFTLNPLDTQTGFSKFLRKLVDSSDAHVLLAMRDDFLFRVHDYPELTPILDELTLLGAPPPGALRLAVVEPAKRFGFAFENEDLPGEMIAKVEGERGALPMLAFAVARLWDKRDRDRRLLTDQAYEEIGGVGGALGQHAESTLRAIGDQRLPIVREIFRNLVTAEGTRAMRQWDELLSVFSDSRSESQAEEVLRRLIDARLLTSYQVLEKDERPTRRVEVVHESLLSSWPRLVRWQTQDADAAQLRDQLRQAARTWDEHDRTNDYLWSGRAYREFALWRSAYPGGLTEGEEDFAIAMTSHNKRRKRRRQIAAVAALGLAIVVAGVFGTLWRRSVAETRRAEAAKLLALAQVQLGTDPTEALAHATASLELADTREARIFAVRALWAAPSLFALDLRQFGAQFQLNLFSPDGRWLVVSPIVNEKVLVFNEQGGDPIVLSGHKATARGHVRCGWTQDGLLVTGGREGRARIWSMPGGRLVREIDFGGVGFWQTVGSRLFATVWDFGDQVGEGTVQLRSWDIRDGVQQEQGTFDYTALGAYDWMADPSGDALIYSKGDTIYSRPLPVTEGVSDSVLARHAADAVGVWHWWRGSGGLFSNDSDGEIILWAAPNGTSVPGRRLRRPETATTRLFSDESGRWAFEDPSDDNRLRLWDREGLLGANPLVLRRVGWWTLSHTDFHPGGGWVIATTRDRKEVSFWPLLKTLPFVVDSDPPWQAWEFTPDGRYLLTSDVGSLQGDWANQLRLWPLPGSGSAEIVDLKLPADARATFRGVTMSANGEQAISRGYGRAVFVIPLNGNEPRQFEGFSSADVVDAVGFSPSGRLAAAATMITEGQATLRVWDLDTDEMTAFDQPEDPEAYQGYFALDLSFVDETALFTAGANGLLRWDIKAGTSERVLGAPPGGLLKMRMTFDRQSMLVTEIGPSLARTGGARLYDLATGEVRSLEIPGDGLLVALSADGAFWVAGDSNGSIWVGRADGGEPHLLLGHGAEVFPMAISPDNRWIASSSITDKTLRLWPMPDLSKPPLHTLPHDELIAKLKTLTNLRVVRDEESSTGWKIEIGPFPGWAEVPEW